MSILVLTSDTLIGTPATGNLEYNGQFFGTDSNASRAQMQRITQGTAVASTSGTSIDFTGLPAWVKRVTVMFSGVSTNGTSALMMQLGDSGGIETTSYTSSGQGFSPTGGLGASTSTAGMLLFDGSQAAMVNDGIYTICNLTGNTWVASGVMNRGNGGFTGYGAGSKALSATLDRVRITTVNGTDTFDAGSINILYEG